MSTMSTSAQPTTLYSTLLIASESQAKNSNQTDGHSLSVIIGVTIASVISFVLILYAIFKYRSRDEGTYTIDERKSFGPFIESDNNSVDTKMTLCTGKSAKTKSKQDIYQNVSKEWYVWIMKIDKESSERRALMPDEYWPYVFIQALKFPHVYNESQLSCLLFDSSSKDRSCEVFGS